MFEGIKGWLCVGLFVVLCLAAWSFGKHEFQAGAQSVQVQWDDATHEADAAKLAQAGKVILGDSAQAANFVSIDSAYQTKVANAQAFPSSTVSILAGVGGLRPVWQCPAEPSGASGNVKRRITVPAPSAGAGRPDGAKSVATSDRSEAAANVVRAGDNADRREQQLGAKVEALQAVVKSYQGDSGP